MNEIRQLKGILLGTAVWCIVRAFIHGFNHDYDATFDLRFFNALVAFGFAAIIIALEQLFKAKFGAEVNTLEKVTRIKENAPDVSIPHFKSLDIAPTDSIFGTKHPIIWVEQDDTLYVYNGAGWSNVP